MQKHFFGNKIRFVMATSVFFGNHHGFAQHKSACASATLTGICCRQSNIQNLWVHLIKNIGLCFPGTNTAVALGHGVGSPEELLPVDLNMVVVDVVEAKGDLSQWHHCQVDLWNSTSQTQLVRAPGCPYSPRRHNCKIYSKKLFKFRQAKSPDCGRISVGGRLCLLQSSVEAD